MGLWRKNKKNNIEKSLQKIVSSTQLPLGSSLDSAHFEVNSNSEVIIEGCKGILQYDENIIKVNMGKMITAFCGRKLSVKCLNTDSLIVTGFITSIEFIT
ncbi:MAG: YabP/YqfC family sporulation protein [Eubacteriales bacterium SKADARSKE-1]|nr:YabP/YqfC family sporulation protein [Eubacteriales bacterium SKADARSKE-1]